MNKLIFTLLLVLCTATTAMAAETVVELPTDVRVQQQDDYSAGVFSQLLGPAWVYIAGPNAVFGGIGQYSGLILAILQAFNMVGMAAVSLVILYQYGILALVTAHTGKVMGGGEASMWTPLRSVIGFALSVPVLHGLSLLQVFIIASIGLGINGGNLIWQASSTYVVQHIDGGVADTQSQIIDSEALEAIQPLFQGVLLQEVARSITHEYSNIKEFKRPTLQSRYRQITIFGDYVVEHRPLEGQSILWIRPLNKGDLGTFGGVVVPAPTAKLVNGVVTESFESASYKAAFEITMLRLDGMIAVAEALRPWAKWYIDGNNGGKLSKPEGDGFTIAEEYRRTVSSGMKQYIEAAKGGKKADRRMSDALGIRKDGDVPSGGWVGAGVLPTILAAATTQADIVNYGGGVRPVVTDATSGIYSDDGSLMDKLIAWWRDELSVHEHFIPHLKRAPRFVTQNLLGGRSWSGHDAQGNSAGALNQGITAMFTNSSTNNNGILASTMRDFNEMNPLSATISFGEKCLKVAGIGLGISAVAGAASVVPGFPGAVAGMLNNGLFLAALGGLGLVGLLCMFIAPTLPLIIWVRGVFGWIVNAFMSLIGAPLLAVAFVFPEGPGFVGQHARKGMVQLLDIAIRPAVMTACLCLAYVLLQSFTLILTALFSKFLNAAGGYMEVGLIWQIGFSIVYVTMVYTTIHFLFTHLVLQAPQSIMTWIGGVGMSLGSVEQATSKDTAIIGGVGGKVATGIAGAGAGAGKSLAEMMKNKKDDQKDDKGKGGGGKDEATLKQMSPRNDNE